MSTSIIEHAPVHPGNLGRMLCDLLAMVSKACHYCYSLPLASNTLIPAETPNAPQIPDLTMSLGNASANGPCSGSVSLLELQANMTKSSLSSLPQTSNGLTHLQALFTNTNLQDCLPHLGAVSTINFALNGKSSIAASFCLANMASLNRTLSPW